jgi:hypothetical protein
LAGASLRLWELTQHRYRFDDIGHAHVAFRTRPGSPDHRLSLVFAEARRQAGEFRIGKLGWTASAPMKPASSWYASRRPT